MKKTILITGTSSGFGKETAKLFQKKGWNVIATMRSPEKEQELTQLENLLVLPLDVEDLDSVKTAVQKGAETFGGIDALVNNAGYGLMGVFEAAEREQIKKQFAVNVFGLIDVTQAALPYLRAKGGAIVNISSFGGVVALPYGGLYNSTKFAVEGLSEALSHELAPFNIRVKIIEPGSIATNFRNARVTIANELPAYNGDAFSKFFGRFAEMTGAIPKASPEDAANTIYEAVMDESPKLRYVVGADAQFFIDLKMNNSDVDFIRSLRTKLID